VAAQSGSASGGNSGASNEGQSGDGVGGAPQSQTECEPDSTRSCKEAGALGPCAEGTQVCDEDGNWGECSVKPAAADSCEPNDDANCTGVANEGCPCVAGGSRSCADAGAKGSCAAGMQVCGPDGTWAACSILPAEKDTCAADNDDNCNGQVNEGCKCLVGERTCLEGGLSGKCASGKQVCSLQGVWSACSIPPAAEDGCTAGNDDDCNGKPNEGCKCINGVTKRACGACSDGQETCSNGKTNEYANCTGAVKLPITYYRDLDGDGFGSATTTTACGTAPSGYVSQTGDCCDDGGDLVLAKTIYPGQPTFFTKAANICGIDWNYDCSPGGVEGTPSTVPTGCTSGSSAPNCVTQSRAITAADCGKTFGGCSCGLSGGTPSGCAFNCGGSFTVKCH
jgi:hypothetical protein